MPSSSGSGPSALLLPLLLAAVACDPGLSPPPLPLAPGVPRELAELRRATLSELNYDVALSVPRERTDPLEGRIRVTFTWNDPLGRDVALDFREAERQVVSLRVNGEPVAPRFAYNHLLLPAGLLEPGGVNEAEVEFTAGDLSLNRHDDFLYTLFVPDRAHAALPVFDQPDLKARVSLALEIPAEWTAIANGPLLEERPGGGLVGAERGEGGRKVLRFGQTEPLSTYLIAFAAGDFQVERASPSGRELILLHRETDRARVDRNLEAVFRLHLTALEWMEEYTGIPYPFSGPFGFVAVPSFQYGGMEHPGAVFYRASSLFLEESATRAQELARASLIAHETAHMWFGDLVTMEWFDDVWTKELFANFMAAKIVHPSFPELDHRLRFLLAHHPAAYAVDRTAGANPIRQPLDNLLDAGTLYGAIIYQKAPVVMQHLELLLGEETLRRGLRRYLREHAYANATWPDLIGILDPLTPEPLAAWSEVWVEEPDRPTVTLRVRGNGILEELELRQEDPARRGRVWPQPLTVVLGYPEGRVERLPARLTGSRAVVEGARGRPTPDFILPNGSGVEYGLFKLDPRSREWLVRNLPSIPEPLLRGTAWVTLWDAVLEGEVDPRSWLSLLLRGIHEEEEELNLQRILGYLGTTWWLLLPEEERERLAPALEAVLWKAAEDSPGASRASALFRGYREMALTEEGVGRVRRIWEGEEEVPGVTLGEGDFTALAAELALRLVVGWEGILDVEEERIGNPDRKARFRFVRPALSPDPEVREAFFLRLYDPAEREREPWVLEALGYLHHPLRRGHGRLFITPSLELLEEVQRTGDIFFPAGWAAAALASHPTPEAAAEVQAFLAARPDYPHGLRLKILQAADLPARAAGIVAAVGSGPPPQAISGRGPRS